MDYLLVSWPLLDAYMALFLRALEIFRQLGDILHAEYMDEVSYLENALHWMKIIWHLEGGS
jgi:hypothetical protein